MCKVLKRSVQHAKPEPCCRCARSRCAYILVCRISVYTKYVCTLNYPTDYSLSIRKMCSSKYTLHGTQKKRRWRRTTTTTTRVKLITGRTHTQNQLFPWKCGLCEVRVKAERERERWEKKVIRNQITRLERYVIWGDAFPVKIHRSSVLFIFWALYKLIRFRRDRVSFPSSSHFPQFCLFLSIGCKQQHTLLNIIRRFEKLNKILILIKVSLFTYLHLNGTVDKKQIFPRQCASPNLDRSTSFAVWRMIERVLLLFFPFVLVLFIARLLYIDTF